MSKIRNDARYVLERMRVEAHPRAFVLGSLAQRVTVLSQQFRAFNLIWALFEQGLLRQGDCVGIVGGGIGGVTTAAAALLKGCKVVLAEERQELMHLQRRNTTRLLHPNIYQWPRSGSDEKSTALPCMNWTADVAGQVVEKLDKEWQRLTDTYHPEVHTQTKVTDFRIADDGRMILTSENWESDPCDIIVAAVGFGVEPSAAGISLDSYWENDKLEQSVRGTQPLKRYLVSGLGDGACIDVLRLTYASFDHGKFATAIARLTDLDRYKRNLLKIELRMPDSGQTEYLREQYEKLSLPANLANQFGTFRADTKVVLNGPGLTPLSARSCILHRVAIWALALAGRLEYCPGNLNVEGIEKRAAATGVHYLVPLPGVGGKSVFDCVVLRHGPRACLNDLPTIANHSKAISDQPAKDRTKTKCYPDGFYPSQDSHDEKKDEQSAFVTRALAADFQLEGQITPSLGSQSATAVFPAPVQRRSLSAESLPQILISEIEELVRTLLAETRAQNYLQATEAATKLEELTTKPELVQATNVVFEVNKALWEYELYVRSRIESGGGTYNLARLRELLRRMERENS